MNKRFFTLEELEALRANKNVLKCSEKAITYSKEFKLTAVMQYNEQGLSPREIFSQAGFDLKIISNERADDCLLRWKRVFKRKGAEGLSEVRGMNSRNGGRKKTKNLTNQEKIKYLEAQVAYLKAENDFLAKLRAKRAE